MNQMKNYFELIFIILCSISKYDFANVDFDYIYLNDNQSVCLPDNCQYYNIIRTKIEFQGNIYYIPPFHEAMINHSVDESFYKQIRHENKLLEYFKRNYDKCLSRKVKFSKKPKIPKIIHQIWIGPNRPPEQFEKWKESWLKLHPTWEYILWDEEKISQLKLINQEFIDQEKNYGAKSDLIRYEIIYQFGGLYIDIDFECIKPLDFLHYCCDFYGSFFEVKRWRIPLWVKNSKMLMDLISHNAPKSFKCWPMPMQDKDSMLMDLMYHNAPRIVNGIFAAKKQHPLLKELIIQAKNFREKKHILTRVGPDYFKNIVISILPLIEGKNIILPSNYFFSWGNKNLNIMPETLGIHHYTGTWGAHFINNHKSTSFCALLHPSG